MGDGSGSKGGLKQMSKTVSLEAFQELAVVKFQSFLMQG